jgi:ipoprotein LpqH
VKCRFLVLPCASVVVAGVAGCSINKSSADPTTSSSTPTTATATSASTSPSTSISKSVASLKTVVLIDGEDQGVGSEQVYCGRIPAVNGLAGAGYLVNILIGNNSSIQLTDADPPQVQSFTFEKSPFNLQYRRGSKPDTNAQAIKLDYSYKITGIANGVEGPNPVTKSFEVDVACP